MSKVSYVEHAFKESSLQVIRACNAIIRDYVAAGYRLTLRQLYYRLVASAQIPNTQRSYDRVGGIINDARLAGLVDWDAIEDRTRNLKSVTHWETPAEIIEAAYEGYRIDKWQGQEFRPEIWIEKEALAGVVERVAVRNDVSFMSCRGYMSQSEMRDAALRYVRWIEDGQTPVIIHLGDHDPSGIDMTRDIRDRLELFCGHHVGEAVDVQRIALNMDQVEEYGPPPNPAKVTDSRFEGYLAQHGTESWELDALEPATLDELIEETVLSYRDDDLYGEKQEQESQERNKLLLLSRNYERIAAGLEDDEA